MSISRSRNRRKQKLADKCGRQFEAESNGGRLAVFKTLAEATSQDFADERVW
jgi:hypothetical protein